MISRKIFLFKVNFCVFHAVDLLANNFRPYLILLPNKKFVKRFSNRTCLTCLKNWGKVSRTPNNQKLHTHSVEMKNLSTTQILRETNFDEFRIFKTAIFIHLERNFSLKKLQKLHKILDCEKSSFWYFCLIKIDFT